MNKKHFLVLLVAAVLLLSSCTPQGGPAKSAAVDPIRDISLFDDDVEKVKALLGTPDEIEEDSGYGYTDLCYEHYSYLGRDVQLDFRMDEDFESSELVISYYYVREYESSGEYDKFEPSAEQLRVAQDFKNEVIELLTSSYGQPVWKSDDGIEFVWEKEQRMDHAECIKLEHGYSKEALIKSARADGERFWFQARFGK